MEIRVRSSKQLLYDLKETRGYWKCKAEALDRPIWRHGFGKVYGPVVRQTRERILQKLYINLCGYLTTKLCFSHVRPAKPALTVVALCHIKAGRPCYRRFRLTFYFKLQGLSMI
jgi:hypothetical protein